MQRLELVRDRQTRSDALVHEERDEGFLMLEGCEGDISRFLERMIELMGGRGVAQGKMW